MNAPKIVRRDWGWLVGLAFLLLACSALAQASDYVQVAPGVYMPPEGPGSWVQATYIYPPGDTRYRGPGVWHRTSLLRSASLPKGLPLGAHGVDLVGILVHSNPPSPGIYSVTAAFRRGGSTSEEAYVGQTCAVNTVGWIQFIGPYLVGYFGIYPPNGARVPAYTPVVLNGDDCSFEWKYTIQNPVTGAPLYPGGPAQGIPMQPGVDAQVNFKVAKWYGVPDLFPWAR